ncbi:MAG: GNAT family N-acetyltransferase [Kofleriaceae bacterium]
MQRTRLAWTVDGRRLEAVEPTPGEVARHAEALALAYNDPANATLLGHTTPLTQADVIEHYADLDDAGAHQFLLYVDGELAGDADLRGVRDGAAEFAFLIGKPATQGQGLGTRFARMIHAFAFAPAPVGLGLARIYVSVVPTNTASLRVFAKLGYREDRSDTARAWADEPGDVVLVVDAAASARAQPALGDDLIIARR